MKITTPSVLAFERKLCCSDGLMYAGSWEDRREKSSWREIHLQHKDVRGTISNRLKSTIASNSMKVDAEIQKANLQAVDIASLPFDADTLKVMFTLRVLSGLFIPSACNKQCYQTVLNEKIGIYLEKEKCSVLALRYAQSLAAGRFLWRNRIGAEDIEIKVTLLEKNEIIDTWVFDGYQYSLRNYLETSDKQIDKLAGAIRSGLMGQSSVFLKVEAFARIGLGQEVFPSQELVRDTGNDKYKKSKVLYSVGDVAAMHSQKIGNALRTIDTWYPGADELGPIAVEPYGSVTNRGIAYRQPKEKLDFYSLLDRWILEDKIPPIEQQHYVVACLIRGGVFGEKEGEKEKDRGEA